MRSEVDRMLSEIDKRPYAHACGKTNSIFCPACVYAEGRKGRDRLLEALKEAHHAISILPQEVRFHYEIRCLTLIEDVLRIEKSEGSKDGK